ncbi:OmpA family protein [Aquimarina pacifica]|uniref:OmpA family protein n=1 Tax=Aquimarina pacifica TaxID=1296415 RepID=UPI00047028B2|nr:OmpA family protein [Aquimarina pacifica]
MPKGIEKIRVIGYTDYASMFINSPSPAPNASPFYYDFTNSNSQDNSNNDHEYPRTFNFNGPEGIQLEAEYHPETPESSRGRAKWIVEHEGAGPFDASYSPKDIGDKVKIDIEAKYCGKIPMIVEAYMNTPENQYPTQLKFTAYATRKIVKAKWGSSSIKYGQDVSLTIDTEGLNGHDLEVHVFNIGMGDNENAAKYYRKVHNGVLQINIKNTYSWKKAHGYLQEGEEEYYIRIKQKGKKEYLKVPGSIESFGKIKVKNEIVKRTVIQPSSPKPLKVGQTEVNLERYEPCGFKALTFVDDGKKIPLFEEGKLKLDKEKRSEFQFEGKIHFDFDKSKIKKDAEKVLNRIAEFLNANPYVPAELGAHCDIRGSHEYNIRLSNHRAAAAVAYLTKKGVAKQRITSKGYGKTRLIHPGEHIPEELHAENRRLTVRFKVKGQDAQTIGFNSIAGNENLNPKKKLTLKIEEFAGTAKCFKKGTNLEHNTDVIVIDPKGKKQTHDGMSDVVQEIYGPMTSIGIAPIDFIWPHSVLPNQYKYHIHTCRYYTIKDKPTIEVKVYPDIKWDFHIFLNLSNKLSVKWQKLTPAQHKEMQKEAGKIGAEKRLKRTDIDFGVKLEAKWNKQSETSYKDDFNVAPKFTKSIKQFYEVFSALKEVSKYITGETKGKITKTRVGKAMPFSVVIEPPNFCLGAEWQCSRGVKNDKPSTEIGTEIKFYLKAEPLIKLELVIDLLALAINAAVGVATGGTGNVAASKLLAEVRDWLSDDDHPITVKMYIELVLSGEIKAETNFTYHTAAPNQGSMAVNTTVGITFRAGIEVKAAYAAYGVEFYALGEASAKGEGSITFGHELKYIGTSNGGSLNYLPKLLFDGIKVTVVVKAEVGMSIRKSWFNFDKSKKLANFNKEYQVVKAFDILEKIARDTVSIPLIKKV